MTDENSRTNLIRAFEKSDVRVILQYLKTGQDLNFKVKPSGQTLLMKFCWEENYNAFMTVLAFKKHLNINETNSVGNTILAYTDDEEHNPFLHSLIQAGVDVNATFSRNQGTCLHRCIQFWNAAGACMLLSAGADPRPHGTIEQRKDETYQKVAKQVRFWVKGLEAAQECFRITFNDEALEALLSSFIFHEEYLRKFL